MSGTIILLQLGLVLLSVATLPQKAMRTSMSVLQPETMLMPDRFTELVLPHILVVTWTWESWP